MPFPFEVPFEQLEDELEDHVDAIFGALESEFLTLPKGEGFVEYPTFESGYEALKRGTRGFGDLNPESLMDVVRETPIAFIVLRTMLGFTPPEWAYVATQRSVVAVSQGQVRTLDRNIRINPTQPLSVAKGQAEGRLMALLATACELLKEGAPETPPTRLHRLAKADTMEGSVSLRSLAELGAPYAMLLYERFLGRPFAGHRDSVSELIGDVLENAIETALSEAGISFRKTKRAERIAGFDQTPDFIIPDEFNPQVVIEAKITEDDGTARDKVTRVQHLHSLAVSGMPSTHEPRFEVIACIGGRGFGVRREDMRKLIRATRGKVFTVRNLDRLVDYTSLEHFRSR